MNENPFQNPLNPNPDVDPAEIAPSENDVFTVGGSDGINGNEQIINCDGCTININEIQTPSATMTPSATQAPTPSPSPTRNRPQRTRPWPYHGVVGDGNGRSTNWPWFMGPPPKGNTCDDPPCTPAFFRKKRSTGKNIQKYGLVELVLPFNIKLTNPVPDSCCVEETKFCGLSNSFLYQSPPPPPVLTTPNDPVGSNDPFSPINPNFFPGGPNMQNLPNAQNSFLLSNSTNSTFLNTTVLSVPTISSTSVTTPTSVPATTTTTTPKTEHENINIQGCYKKFGMASVISRLEMEVYIFIPIGLAALNHFVQIIFSICLCITPPPADQKYSNHYGRRPIKVSGIL